MGVENAGFTDDTMLEVYGESVEEVHPIVGTVRIRCGVDPAPPFGDTWDGEASEEATLQRYNLVLS